MEEKKGVKVKNLALILIFSTTIFAAPKSIYDVLTKEQKTSKDTIFVKKFIAEICKNQNKVQSVHAIDYPRKINGIVKKTYGYIRIDCDTKQR